MESPSEEEIRVASLYAKRPSQTCRHFRPSRIRGRWTLLPNYRRLLLCIVGAVETIRHCQKPGLEAAAQKA